MTDFADKSEAPTLHRRNEARRDGKLAISAELTAAVVCLCAAMVLQQTGGTVLQALRLLLVEGLEGGEDLHAGRIGLLLLKAMTPLLVVLTLSAIVVNAAQTRCWIGRRRDTGVLNPSVGVKRLFGRRAAFAMLMHVVKVSAVVLVSVVTVRGAMGRLVALPTMPVEEVLGEGMGIVFTLAIRLSLIFIVLGSIDYLFQRQLLEHDLRMTRREVRDELRRQEGSAELKRRRNAMWQRKMA